MTTSRFLTMKALAAELAISDRAAYRVAEKIGIYRFGASVRVERDDLERWLRNQAPEHVEPKKPAREDGAMTLTKIRPVKLPSSY